MSSIKTTGLDANGNFLVTVLMDSGNTTDLVYSPNPPAGDSRTVPQWQAACQAEAAALLGIVLGNGGPNSTIIDDTVTELG